jgi:hypothetical protein
MRGARAVVGVVVTRMREQAVAVAVVVVVAVAVVMAEVEGAPRQEENLMTETLYPSTTSGSYYAGRWRDGGWT